MTLVVLLLLPLAGGLLAGALGKRPTAGRWTSILALAVGLVLSLRLCAAGGTPTFEREWIPSLGIGFRLAADGLSAVMIVLTFFLGLVAVAVSWREIDERAGFFHFSLLSVLAGIVGVFLAADLVLLMVFWELMLVPMVLLIAIWGHERKIYAAIKFFLFTQAGGLLMLVAIVALGLARRDVAGELSFAYRDLLGTPLDPDLAFWLMLGFFFAFAVKLPAFLLHTWLPDAHTQAPTAGSVVLAGLLLKTGAYGLLRFAVPLFPGAAERFAPFAMALGAAGIVYGAVLAFSQMDLKRLVAYTSVSHLGFVLLGVYAWNELALQGTVMQMICHGLSTGGLFALAGMLAERTHSRDLASFGGLWDSAPRMGGVAMVLAMASLGLPGLGGFVGELLILAGAWRENRGATTVAAIGLLLAAIYSVRLVQRTFHGPGGDERRIADLSARETVALGALVVALVVLGLYPQPVFDVVTPVFAGVEPTQLAAPGGGP